MRWLERNALYYPERPAVFARGVQVYTWAELHDVVQAKDFGLRAGARVALSFDDPVAFVVAALSAWNQGLTLVPLNRKWTRRETDHVLLESNAELILNDDGEHATGAKSQDGDASIAAILFTSGTSGAPKPVGLTWRNFESSALASAAVLGMQADDRWLCCLPMSHVGGLSILTRSLIYGTALDVLPKFDVQDALASLEAGATLASFVPTMLRQIAGANALHWPASHRGSGAARPEVWPPEDPSHQASVAARPEVWPPQVEDPSHRGSGAARPEVWPPEDSKWPHLRAVLLGGAAPNSADIAWCQAQNIAVWPTYGLTETCSQIATAYTNQPEGCSGLPLPSAELRIMTPSGEAAPGVEGTIEVRGPMVFSGYLNRPEVNAERFHDGWFDTGDLGRLDEHGRLFVLTRRDDLIVSGGYNVYPAEVESVVLSHPAVSECAVFGIPDDEWGAVVCLAVVWREETVDLKPWFDEQLARYKHPRRIFELESLPRTSSGKIRHAALREQFSA